MLVPKLRFNEFTDEWKSYKLSDVVDFLDGQRKPIKDTDRNSIKGIYPYYGASGIIDYINDYIFDEELLLLGEDGANIITRSTKLVFKATEKYWVNNHAHVLKPKNRFNINFLEAYLENLNYEQYNTGTAQPKLNQEVCRKIIINTPNEKEQEKIGETLSLIDQKIELQNKKIEVLKLYKKGTLNTLTNNVDNNNLKTLKEIGTDYSGLSGKSKEDFDTGTSNFITYMSVFKNAIDKNSFRKVNVNSNENQNSVKNKDLFFTVSSETKEEVGMCATINTDNKDLYLNSFCFGYRLNDTNSVNNNYLCYLLLSEKYRKIISDLGQGFTRVNLSKKELLNVLIPIPSIEYQLLYSNTLKTMDTRIKLESDKLEKFNELKKGLMQSMFV